jgi:hypothetical protein
MFSKLHGTPKKPNIVRKEKNVFFCGSAGDSASGK